MFSRVQVVLKEKEMAASAAAAVTDEEEQKFLGCGLCFENDELKRLQSYLLCNMPDQRI